MTTAYELQDAIVRTNELLESLEGSQEARACNELSALSRLIAERAATGTLVEAPSVRPTIDFELALASPWCNDYPSQDLGRSSLA